MISVNGAYCVRDGRRKSRGFNAQDAEVFAVTRGEKDGMKRDPRVHGEGTEVTKKKIRMTAFEDESLKTVRNHPANFLNLPNLLYYTR